MSVLHSSCLSEEMHSPSADDHKMTYVDFIGKISLAGTFGWITSLARLVNAGTDRLEVYSNLSTETRSFFSSHSVKA